MRHPIPCTLLLIALATPAAADRVWHRDGARPGDVEVHAGPGSRLTTERRVHVPDGPARRRPPPPGLHVVRGTAAASPSETRVHDAGCAPQAGTPPLVVNAAFLPPRD